MTTRPPRRNTTARDCIGWGVLLAFLGLLVSTSEFAVIGILMLVAGGGLALAGIIAKGIEMGEP